MSNREFKPEDHFEPADAAAIRLECVHVAQQILTIDAVDSPAAKQLIDYASELAAFVFAGKSST